MSDLVFIICYAGKWKHIRILRSPLFAVPLSPWYSRDTKENWAKKRKRAAVGSRPYVWNVTIFIDWRQHGKRGTGAHVRGGGFKTRPQEL